MLLDEENTSIQNKLNKTTFISKEEKLRFMDILIQLETT